MKKVKEMNGTEKRAWREVKNAFNWVVGGYENSVCDGHIAEMPSYEELVDEIYWTVMNCTTEQGYQSSKPCDEVRFAGTAFIMECIYHVMETGEFQYDVKHAERTDLAKEPETSKDDKLFFSVVRFKKDIKKQPFFMMAFRAKTKRHAEDVLFNIGIAPYGNKIFTEVQILEADSEWLKKLGIEDVENQVAKAKADMSK